ncbi:MAG: hypothetical protein PF481_05070 [Bacteroidales bacterium]|jgi:hypothetical protein|nr:hypothetical protein [Bacteroidales bacterium]
MIQVYISHTFVPEKTYLCKVLFSEILHQTYTIHSSPAHTDYRCVAENGATIIIADDFFAHYSETEGYLTTSALPHKKLVLTHNGENIPFFYGTPSIHKDSENTYFVDADICASAFFMLARWEEYVIQERDEYGRFPETEACAISHNLTHIPLVHVYAELLRTLFAELGYSIPYNRTFTKTITHDIDFTRKWHTGIDFLKTGAGDIIKRCSPTSLVKTLSQAFSKQDPYNTYSYLMDLSEQYGCTSVFYMLLSPQNHKFFQSAQGQNIAKEIQSRGHHIGIHFNEYHIHEIDEMQKHCQDFLKLFGFSPTISRQHFLQFSYPETLIALESCGITQDSSLYYRHKPGFRTGMCIEHSTFDVIHRKELQIKELPLTFMDVSIFDYDSPKEAESEILNLMSMSKKYAGNFVCLWHNSSFYGNEWKNVLYIYKKILRFS